MYDDDSYCPSPQPGHTTLSLSLLVLIPGGTVLPGVKAFVQQPRAAFFGGGPTTVFVFPRRSQDFKFKQTFFLPRDDGARPQQRRFGGGGVAADRAPQHLQRQAAGPLQGLLVHHRRDGAFGDEFFPALLLLGRQGLDRLRQRDGITFAKAFGGTGMVAVAAAAGLWEEKREEKQGKGEEGGRREEKKGEGERRRRRREKNRKDNMKENC